MTNRDPGTEIPKILVIGSRGMLARDLLEIFDKSGLRAVGLARPEIDITAPGDLERRLESLAPSIVVNCAAYTAVDKAETEQEAAFAVNRDGVRNLALACAKTDCPLIHVSTDYVFDGCARTPYREDDPTNPLGVYGRSKLEGEEALRGHLPRHLIFRTAWLYGVHGNNFVKTVLRLAREREELRIVSDQHGCPTWTHDLAEALFRAVRSFFERRGEIEWGTYHFCNAGQTTWHGFAGEIVSLAASREPLRVKNIVPIATHEYPVPAKRPAWSVMDCAKVAKNFGVVPPHWKDSLRDMIQRLYAVNRPGPG